MSAGKGSFGGSSSVADSNTSSETDVSNLEQIGKQPRSNGSALTKGEIFDLLKNSRRRKIIEYLREHGGSAKLDELAEHIAADENDITVQQLSSDQRKRVYIGLYQCHLPKMDTLGVVEYDKNRGTVELQESVSSLVPYMEWTDDETDAGERSWLIPAVATGILVPVGLGTLGVGPLAAIPPAGWTLLSVVGIVFIVLLQQLT
ncbi:hypothetical protein DQW50_07780 [Halorubrum sp. 48-1-W]|uniref:DUF7344 domain-containing protein n=1 Tax=Halorubrum sp. 48-1-W TaxID=2249761 RepID=UPI000DCE8FAB|nr:hypothetical protein [Halorubrum sp. 48-1-W]RAW45642.1 hypothetical protein DQW50_07780 [Halorubrum sp. 48-1-W]